MLSSTTRLNISGINSGGGNISGTISATEIAYGSSVDTISGDTSHTIDPVTGYTKLSTTDVQTVSDPKYIPSGSPGQDDVNTAANPVGVANGTSWNVTISSAGGPSVINAPVYGGGTGLDDLSDSGTYIGVSNTTITVSITDITGNSFIDVGGPFSGPIQPSVGDQVIFPSGAKGTITVWNPVISPNDLEISYDAGTGGINQGDTITVNSGLALGATNTVSALLSNQFSISDTLGNSTTGSCNPGGSTFFDGVEIIWGYMIGHSLTDTWTIDVTAATVDQFTWTDSLGGSGGPTDIDRNNPQVLSNSFAIGWDNDEGHTLGDLWIFTADQAFVDFSVGESTEGLRGVSSVFQDTVTKQTSIQGTGNLIDGGFPLLNASYGLTFNTSSNNGLSGYFTQYDKGDYFYQALANNGNIQTIIGLTGEDATLLFQDQSTNLTAFFNGNSKNVIMQFQASANANASGFSADSNGAVIQSNSVSWSWPNLDGVNGDSLLTDGAGTLSFGKPTASAMLTEGFVGIGQTGNVLGISPNFTYDHNTDDFVMGDTSGNGSIEAGSQIVNIRALQQLNYYAGTYNPFSAQVSGTDIVVEIGDITSAVNGTKIQIIDASGTIFVTAQDTYFSGNIHVPVTITPTGTTGNVTIDKVSGSFNFGAGDTSIVLTDSLIDVNSRIFVQVRGTDPTLTYAWPDVVTVPGQVTVYGNNSATAETRIDFFVLN